MQAMRAVLRRRASVHMVEKDVLLAAFAAVLRKRTIVSKDTVRTEQFQVAWKGLDVSMSAQQAAAIFNKYGQVSDLHGWHWVNMLLSSCDNVAGARSCIALPQPIWLAS